MEERAERSKIMVKKTRIVRKVEGVRIPFVSIDTLIKTKTTGRLQDKADIEKLKQLKAISVRSK